LTGDDDGRRGLDVPFAVFFLFFHVLPPGTFSPEWLFCLFANRFTLERHGIFFLSFPASRIVIRTVEDISSLRQTFSLMVVNSAAFFGGWGPSPLNLLL